MYRTCLFCNRPLGANESFETFPVGKRLAFDAAQGRLWVVCRACERWNLSPLDERWEAIEEMERRFRDTRLRVSTGEIGLARLREGTELVRIGSPLRPEMAAWRYGDQFGRRRMRAITRVGAGFGAAGLVVMGGTAWLGLGFFYLFGQAALERALKGNPEAVVARLETDDGTREVRRRNLEHVALTPSSDGRWRLLVGPRSELLRFEGADAVRASARILPAMNRFGGRRRHVRDAVGLLEEAGGPERCFLAISRMGESRSFRLHHLTAPVRLALEMAAHEETERAAMEGDLRALEHQWREAEELAAIADGLVPVRIEARLEEMRGRGSTPAANRPSSRPDRQ